MKMEEKETFRPIPGLSREAEEKQLAEIIGIAQENLTKTVNSIRQLSDDVYEIYDLMEVEESEAKQSLLLLHNTQSQLRESQRELMRCRKARKKPYFGRIDFKDTKRSHAESYYVGRVGIAKDGIELSSVKLFDATFISLFGGGFVSRDGAGHFKGSSPGRLKEPYAHGMRVALCRLS